MLSFIDTLFQKESKLTGYTYSKNYQGKEDYYQNLIREDSTSRFLEVYARQTEAFTNPGLCIRFRNLPFGISAGEVVNLMGKPRYEYDNDRRITSHKIFFYRTGLSHFRAVSQLHFINDQFFYAKYSFRNYDTENLENVLSALKDKYFYTKQFTDKISQVKDEDKNTVMVEKSIHLGIAYLSGNPYFYQFINGLERSKRENEANRHSRQLKALQDSL